jgi:raffinose/stachyose/melibiose transport system substrate-binding protein
MLKKRTMLFAGMMAAALSLTACSTSTTSTSEGKTLTIAATTTSKPAVVKIISAFEKANPGVTVRATYAETDALVTTLRTQLSSGTAPDVFSVWPGYGNAAGMNILQKSGYLADLSDQSWVSEIPAGLKKLTTVDKKTYILPVAVVGIGAIYNEQAVAAAGATVPTTFPGVLKFCDAATKAGKVAFALGNQAAWVTQLVNYALVPTTVFEKDPNFDAKMAAGNATFANSGWKKAFNEYIEMNSRHCFNDDSLGTSFETSVTDVAKGDALAVVQVTSTIAQVRAEAPAGAKFSLFALPGDSSAADTWMPAAMGDTYGVNAKSKVPALAKKFLAFLSTSKEIASYATTAGTLPALPSKDYKVDPALKVLVDFQAKGRTYPFMDQLWPNTKIQSVHLDGVQKVFAGTESVDDVLKAMDAAYAEGTH